MRKVYTVEPAKCDHEWEYLHQTLHGLVCSHCGFVWNGADVCARVQLRSARVRVRALEDRLEAVEDALAHNLSITTCNHCGKWIPKGNSSEGFSLDWRGSWCLDCLTVLAEETEDWEGWEQDELANLLPRYLRDQELHQSEKITKSDFEFLRQVFAVEYERLKDTAEVHTGSPACCATCKNAWEREREE